MPYVRSHPRTYKTHPHASTREYYDEDLETLRKWNQLDPVEKSVTYPFFDKIDFDLLRYMELREEAKKHVENNLDLLHSPSLSIEEKKQIKKEAKEFIDYLYNLEEIYERRKAKKVR